MVDGSLDGFGVDGRVIGDRAKVLDGNLSKDRSSGRRYPPEGVESSNDVNQRRV
jgi:hypothetical protein